MTSPILTLLSHSKLNEFYAAGYWRDDTIYSLVEQHATLMPDRVAVRDQSGTITYQELAQRAKALSAALTRQGLRPGDRVAVWLSSRIETAIIFVACSRSGFICCPSLHRDHTVSDILTLMNRMHAAAFFGEDRYGADAQRHDIFAQLAEVPTLKAHYRLSRPGTPQGDALPSAHDAFSDTAKTDPNEIVYLAFTSGTTGIPKGVMHSDNTLLANARA